MKPQISKTQTRKWLTPGIIGGGVILLGLVFLVFLGVLLFSSVSTSLFEKCVAVIEINGEITTTNTPRTLFSEGIIGSEEIAGTIEKLNVRDDVGAVVFVIDSPGGSIVASHEIYDAIKNLRKPKVAYFHEIAASGGYYIATGTDYIISEPSALTGSIGAIMVTADMSGLFEKIGVNVSTIKSGELKDIGGPNKPLTEKERQILQTLINEMFGEFKSIVLENRGSRLNSEKFNEILDARILSGKQAKEIGLVDALGHKKDAIRKAAQLANITEEEPSVCKIEISSGSAGFFDVSTIIPAMTKNMKKVSIRYE